MRPSSKPRAEVARRWLGALLVLLAAQAPAAMAAAEDTPGSRDPFGVSRYPRAWIVDYRRDEEVRPREFVTSRVDRIRRDLRVPGLLRVDGLLESVTYRIPDGVAVADVVAHYAEQLGSDVLFRCQGRGCGRSNDWANQVFNQAILYGPDTNQVYVAREWQGRLVALYAIERGNQRTYVHLRFVEPMGGLGLEPNALLVQRLNERGWASVDGVEPGPDGSIDTAGRRLLEALAGPLAEFAGQPIYVVCHVYGPQQPQALLDASRRCAEAGVEAIAAGSTAAGSTAAGAGSGELELQAFGAGALLPRPNLRRPRLEIVLPAVVSRRRD